MPRIITLTCSNCGTIVTGNVLEDHRELKCPRIDCETVLRFSDLAADEQQHLTNNRDQYTMNRQ